MSAVARARTKNTMYARRLAIYLNAGPPTALFGGVRRAQAFIMTTVMHHDSSNAAWHWQIDSNPKGFVSHRYGDDPVGYAGDMRSATGDYLNIRNVALQQIEAQTEKLKGLLNPSGGKAKNLQVTLINPMPSANRDYAIAAGLSNLDQWDAQINSKFLMGAQAWFDYWHNGFNAAMKSGFNWEHTLINSAVMTLKPME